MSIWESIKTGKLDEVKDCIEKQSVDINKPTPLINATYYGQSAICQYLILKGCNLSSQDNSGKTALHMSIWKKKPGVARLLLSKGIDFRLKDKIGLTALGMAANYENDLIVKFILEKDTKLETLNVPDVNGNTPLHHAVLFKNVKIIKMLLKSGAKIDKQNNNQATVVDIAKKDDKLKKLFNIKEKKEEKIEVKEEKK